MQIPKRPIRKFMPKHLEIDSWEKLEPFFKDLEDRGISSKTDLEKWMLDRSELESVLEEDMAWRYIKMNIDTTDIELAKKFHFWINDISPKAAPYTHKLNLKLINSPFTNDLDFEKYKIYLRGVRQNIKLFREENIPLFTKMEKKQQEYGAIFAKMSVEINGQEMTLQKATALLKGTDRKKRKEVYDKISERTLKDEVLLDNLLDELIALRQKIAKNAGFENYRDYKFAAMGRFDYNPEDCFNFHSAIEKEIVPIINSFEKERSKKLKYDSYKPWDTSVDESGKPPLKPFKDGDELLKLTIECFNKLNPYFGDCISVMKEMNHLDLDSKKGKAPGGFMYPLYEIGVPFIYMNAVGSQRDVVTMIHEGGHAVHSFLSRNLELTEFKSTPSEVAELASMSMELISMDYWNVFYDSEEELKRSKLEQLKKALGTLPWVASIDKFQHWIYTNSHTAKERKDKWIEIYNKLGNNEVDWKGYENVLANLWQKQLHIYEVPFYYIEYGMAQLGAIAIWRSYKLLGDEAIDNYMSALRLGYTKTISEIYKQAGIEFNFSDSYVKELAEFINAELKKI